MGIKIGYISYIPTFLDQIPVMPGGTCEGGTPGVQPLITRKICIHADHILSCHWRIKSWLSQHGRQADTIILN